MHEPKIIIQLVIACALAAYGWWCLFRTEAAANFLGDFYPGSIGRSLNLGMTKLHGILGFLFASLLLFEFIKALVK